MSKIITCEQVSSGHPDKICDQIADAIVTDCLQHDKNSRVAIECMLKNSRLFIAGELTSKHKPDYHQLAYDVLRRIGYDRLGAGVEHCMDIGILVSEQSPDIALGVDKDGAGDQGIMYGYAELCWYTDNRSLAAEGIDPEGYSERYYYYYPVWRCTKNAQGASHGCTSGSTYECALEQSFMENLYWLKRDLEANGDASWLMRQFAAACEKMERASGRNSYSTQRLQTVEMQIRELEEKLNKTVANQVEAMRIEALEKTAEAKHTLENGSTDDVPVDIMSGISTVGLGTQWFCGDEINSDSEAAIYEELANDIRDRIADLKKERDALELEQGATTIARKNFDFFVRCLKALPEANFSGMKINVNGLDVQGSLFRDMEGKAIAGKRSSARSGHIKITEEKLAAAPDYLNFEKGIYTAFIKSGVVKGDTVEYRIQFEGKTLYVFDLMVPEIFHERKSRKKNEQASQEVAEMPNEDAQNNNAAETEVNTRKGYYPDDVANTFGVPVEQHRADTEIQQMDGYISVGILTGERK